MKRIISMGILLVLAGWNAALAETLYVRAQPTVALASGPGPEAVVTQRLTPGDEVTVIARETGFVNVETADGMRGWINEAALTALVPAARRLPVLEAELASVREELAGTQNTLRNTQAELRRARQSAEAARDSGQGQVSELENEAAALREELAARSDQVRRLQQQLAELEMAQEASRLLAATAPSTAAASADSYSLQTVLSAIAAGLLLCGAGLWLGAMFSRRRLRHRYHGLEL